jgi:hypothetical protein
MLRMSTGATGGGSSGLAAGADAKLAYLIICWPISDPVAPGRASLMLR